jgi:hypothetical protein
MRAVDRPNRLPAVTYHIWQVTFRYYDHLVASVSPFGGHLRGNTIVHAREEPHCHRTHCHRTHCHRTHCHRTHCHHTHCHHTHCHHEAIIRTPARRTLFGRSSSRATASTCSRASTRRAPRSCAAASAHTTLRPHSPPHPCTLLTVACALCVLQVRCRFGSHPPVNGEIFTDAAGLVSIRCATSSSEANGGTTTAYVPTSHLISSHPIPWDPTGPRPTHPRYRYVPISISINQQNFLPSLSFCEANSDACAKFRYYTEAVRSLWPVAGPAAGGSTVTITGEFSPGFDGVRTSAKCLFRSGVSTVCCDPPNTITTSHHISVGYSPNTGPSCVRA